MNKVLVHCQMGRSRSATLVIMYIYYKQIVDELHDDDLSIETVHTFVRNLRNVVDPNIGFIDQLSEFEELVKSGELQKRVSVFDFERKSSMKNDTIKEENKSEEEWEQGS